VNRRSARRRLFWCRLAVAGRPGLSELTPGGRQQAADHISIRRHTGRGGEVRVATGVDRAVQRRAGLKAPAFGERAGIDRVVADRVQERRYRRLRLRVVTRDRQRRAFRRTRRAGQRLKVLEEDVVEALDDLGPRKVLLEQFAAGGGAVVQLRELPVTGGVVVAGVDDGLPRQRPLGTLR